MAQDATPGLMARLMRRVGYTPEARVRELSDALARARQQVGELTRKLDEVRAEARSVKEKARERGQQQQDDREHLKKMHEERLAKAEKNIAREIERVRTHDVGRHEKLEDMRGRLSGAEQSLRLGREHLMAIEVKLDIIEGAITVLDQRTRAALAAKHS
jgi:chromosome segregation ATPase